MVSQNKIGRIILLSSLSSILYGIESFIPKPFPFLRIGLGNILVLFSIINMGITSGIIVGVSKSIIGGLLSGTFLTPSTILSITGTLSSIVLMFFLKNMKVFGIIGISTAGSIMNTFVQVLVVSFIFTGLSSLIYLLKTLLIFSTITGVITGIITFYLLESFERRKYAIESFS